VRLVDIDGNGKPRYMLDGGRLHPIPSRPGDVFKRPRPGSLYDYFAGKSDKGRLGSELSSEEPLITPSGSTGTPAWRAWSSRVSSAWLFPSQAVCMEGPMQPDIEAAIHILGAFNQWLEEDWVSHTRIGYSVCPTCRSPTSTRPSHSSMVLGPRCAGRVDPQWARIHAGGHKITRRPDVRPFLGACGRSRHRGRSHAGFEDGYVRVTQAVAEEWAYLRRRKAQVTPWSSTPAS